MFYTWTLSPLILRHHPVFFFFFPASSAGTIRGTGWEWSVVKNHKQTKCLFHHTGYHMLKKSIKKLASSQSVHTCHICWKTQIYHWMEAAWMGDPYYHTQNIGWFVMGVRAGRGSHILWSESNNAAFRLLSYCSWFDKCWPFGTAATFMCCKCARSMRGMRPAAPPLVVKRHLRHTCTNKSENPSEMFLLRRILKFASSSSVHSADKKGVSTEAAWWRCRWPRGWPPYTLLLCWHINPQDASTALSPTLPAPEPDMWCAATSLKCDSQRDDCFPAGVF